MRKDNRVFRLRSITVYFILTCGIIFFLSLTPPTLASSHGPVLISGNSQFTPANGVVSGSGSAADPYIIANWEIDASTQDAIKIASTDAHFVIRNCTISGGTGSGIYLANVTNGEVEGNTCKNSRVGIWLHFSSNNTISNNTCSNMLDYGIYVDVSNNNSLTQNTCFSNQYYGIRVYQSSYTFLTYNNCSYNNDGIRCDWSTYNTLMRNTIANNLRYGVWCAGPHTMITNCSIYNNGDYGVSNDLDPANVANATNCWWGDSSGPGGAGPGTGDEVSANVLYDPWLTSLTQHTTLTIQSSASNVAAGSTVTMSGSLSPAIAGKTITLAYAPPSGTPVNRTATTNTQGQYQDMYQPQSEGIWIVIAYFVGDSQYGASSSTPVTFNVTAQQQPKSGCVVATATFGSAMAPQVQALRDFRETIALKTFAGSSFMAVFNEWYYSWSPPVASVIAPSEPFRAVMQVVLQPVLNILDVATFVNSALSFNGEFAIVSAGFVASALIGLVYFLPLTTLAMFGVKRCRRDIALPSPSRALRFTAIPWLVSIVLIAVAEIAMAPILMMVATSAFVILTIALTVSTVSLWLVGFYRRG